MSLCFQSIFNQSIVLCITREGFPYELSMAVPEVEGPNSRPTGSRFDTSTEGYADGWPPTPTITESARRARAARMAMLEEQVELAQDGDL